MNKVIRVWESGIWNHYGEVELAEFEDGTFAIHLEDWSDKFRAKPVSKEFAEMFIKELCQEVKE